MRAGEETTSESQPERPRALSQVLSPAVAQKIAPAWALGTVCSQAWLEPGKRQQEKDKHESHDCRGRGQMDVDRLLVWHLSYYCERGRGPVPSESLSDCDMALALGMAVGHSRPLSIIARTQRSLSLHFSPLGMQESLWICLSTMPKRYRDTSTDCSW